MVGLLLGVLVTLEDGVFVGVSLGLTLGVLVFVGVFVGVLLGVFVGHDGSGVDVGSLLGV